MHRGSLAVAAAFFGVIAAACSSSSSTSKPLDCAYLASDANCWKTTLAASSGCLPASGEIGTMSADGKTCAFASGHTVTFDSPLAFPVPTDQLWAFTVSSGGQQCLRFQEPQHSEFILTTSAGTAHEASAGGALTLSCPDGTSYSNASPLSLLSCGADSGISLGGLPGILFSSSSTQANVSLFGGGPAAVQIFTCKK